MENAVDTHTNIKLFFIRLDMDVARPFFGSLLEEGVEKPDDRRVFNELQEIPGLFKFRGDGREVIARNVIHHLCRRADLAVEAADGFDKESLFNFYDTLRQPIFPGKFGDGEDPFIIRDGRDEVSVLSLERENKVVL